MITQEVLAYIQQEISLGTSYQDIVSKLVASGWHKQDVLEAIRQASHPNTPQYTTTPKSQSTQILNEFNALFHQTFNYYWLNKKRFLIFQLIIGVFLLLNIVFTLMVTKNIAGFIRQSKSQNYFFLMESAIFIFFAMVSFFIDLYPYTALYYSIIDENYLMSIKDCFKKAWLKKFQFPLIQLIGGGAISAVLLIAFVIYFLLHPIISSYLNFPIFWLILFAVGLLLILDIVFYILIQMSIASYVFIVENVGIKESYRRSRKYTKSHLFSIFMHMLIIGVLSLALNLLPLVGTIINFFLFPLWVIYMYLIYKKIKFIYAG